MGLLFALFSSVMWGTADFLGGVMSRRLPVVAVVLGSQCCAFVVMLVVATASGSWGTPRDYLVSGIAAGLTGLIGLSLFYAALATGTMGIVSPIAALGVLVPLAFGLVLGQLPTAGQYVGRKSAERRVFDRSCWRCSQHWVLASRNSSSPKVRPRV